MAPCILNEYERKRLHNIRRNEEIMASLKLYSAATNLSAAFKHSRNEAKSRKMVTEKNPKTETPIVVRRSLRTRGMPPESQVLNDLKSPTKIKPCIRNLGFMAPCEINEYERKRLHNIRRNEEMMASLKLHFAATSLSAAFKHSRNEPKSRKMVTEKNPKTETPIVVRRSLRTRGMPPESQVLNDLKSPTKIKPCVRNLGPLARSDVYCGGAADDSLIKAIVGMAKNDEHLNGDEGFGSGGVGVSGDADQKERKEKTRVLLELGSLALHPQNVARVVRGGITAVRFFPSSSAKMIVVGNRFGNVGFWDVGSAQNEGSNKVYLYRPHSATISGILIQRSSLSKIYTSCFGGFIRLMDTAKEVFDVVISSEKAICCLSQPSDDANCLYFGDGWGGLSAWDDRMGKCSFHWVLHEHRINTIDFSPGSSHIMATASTDGTACMWDLRNINGEKLKTLRTFTHKRTVNSAFFSPSGSSLATTSLDNTIGILSGINYEDTSTIYHKQRQDGLCSFRAIWGWDDSYIFVGNGNIKRGVDNIKSGVDVISPIQRKRIMTLRSPHVSAIPCKFDAHPGEVGTLAGATACGQVYMWTSC